MLCTTIRATSFAPDYTPEPDIIHEAIGHIPNLPMLTSRPFHSSSVAVQDCSNEAQLEHLSRLYWYTVEFGLVEEGQQSRRWSRPAFLVQRIGHAFSDKVDDGQFSIEEVIATEYDYSTCNRCFCDPVLQLSKGSDAQVH
jgi:phenylalanine-4-hydroxylase